MINLLLGNIIKSGAMVFEPMTLTQKRTQVIMVAKFEQNVEDLQAVTDRTQRLNKHLEAETTEALLAILESKWYVHPLHRLMICNLKGAAIRGKIMAFSGEVMTSGMPTVFVYNNEDDALANLTFWPKWMRDIKENFQDPANNEAFFDPVRTCIVKEVTMTCMWG